MKVYLFPGQGSQSRGMGRDLFDLFPDLTSKADKILGYSIKELCLEDPRRELNKTQFTQPALFVVNALSYYKTIEESGEVPDYLAGHSLGEFNALLAAECFDFEAGLKMVKKRGELMAGAPDGAMAAILNASKDEIEDILKKNNLNNIDLANFNTFSQIVISGSREEIAKAESLFQNGDVVYHPLNTSGAFHSRFMHPVMEKFVKYLKKFKLSDLTTPVISNVTAKPYKNENILDNLTLQLSSCVRWADSIKYLIETAAAENSMIEFKEIGHGDVLTKIVDKIKEETSDIWAEVNVVKDEETVHIDASKQIGNRSGEPEKSDVAEAGRQKKESVLDQEIKKDNLSDGNSLSMEYEDVDSPNQVEEKVKSWNQRYPIGSKFTSLTENYEELESRTEAVVLFGHRAAIYMKGFNGYFDLDELEPA